MIISETKKALVGKVQATEIMPKGFRNEAALLESIVENCRGKKTVMVTGNYVVREGPNVQKGDPRLLGEGMLLTMELCARAIRGCARARVTPPAVLLVPNDLVPETFSTNMEERSFKMAYTLPEEIRAILDGACIAQEPLYFFNRDFGRPERTTHAEFLSVRKRIMEGTEKLIVTMESFAQNLASKVLRRNEIKGREEFKKDARDRTVVIVPARITDTFTGAEQLSSSVVTITNPNGAPFCSFLAATLFREFETFGFEQMVNTFVLQEHPCVDKAAAAYRSLYGGKMGLRNIYLDGAKVAVDSTIL